MFPKRHNRLDRFVTAGWVILVIGLSVALYTALKPVHSTYTPDTDLAQQADTDATARTAPDAPDFSVIWMGEPDLPKRASSDAASSADSSTESNAVNFQLRGVFYDPSGVTMACLCLKGEQSLYGIGDAIDNWEISEIDAESVTIIRDGKRRTLRMSMPAYAYVPSRDVSDETTSDESTTVWKQTVTRPVPGAPSGQGVARVKKLSPTTTRPKPRPKSENLADVDATVAVAANIVDRLRDDPTSVEFGVGFTPDLNAKGKIQGIRLNSIASGSLAAQYGLAPGDRILAVNGQPITSLAGAMQLYQRYRTSDSVRVTIDRGGLLRNVLFYAR